MLKSGDIAGRLRLLRYGLVVVVIITFLVSWLVPYVITSAYATELNSVAEALEASGGGAVPRADITIFTFLTTALGFTLAVAVLSVAVYFAYRWWLNRGITTTTTTATAM